MKLSAVLVCAALSFLSINANAAEPAFCNPETFSRYERSHQVSHLKKAHVYRIGSLTLVGLGVGESDPASVMRLARQHGVRDRSSCTWYFNDGNDSAAQLFNHVYVPNPIFRSTSISQIYRSRIGPEFTQRSLLECAGREKYIAMGCDGMKHRGPSVFAMFLAYAGCSADNATKIANNVWGKNFVPSNTRRAIAEEGKRIGDRDVAGRAYLQKLMGVRR